MSQPSFSYHLLYDMILFQWSFTSSGVRLLHYNTRNMELTVSEGPVQDDLRFCCRVVSPKRLIAMITSTAALWAPSKVFETRCYYMEICWNLFITPDKMSNSQEWAWSVREERGSLHEVDDTSIFFEYRRGKKRAFYCTYWKSQLSIRYKLSHPRRPLQPA